MSASDSENRRRIDVPYQPYTDNSFFPGLIDEARQEKLLTYDFDVTEITADDVVWLLSKGVPGTAYTALRWVKDKFGEEAAQEMAREFGYQTGAAIFDRYRRKVGVAPGEPLTTEQFVEFQDLAHSTMGVDAVHAYSGYDDEKAWVSRQRCTFGGFGPFTNAPPGLRGICTYAELGFISAYKELQPTMIWDNTHNMGDPTVVGARGRAICGFMMWMTIPEEARERAAVRASA
jgi:hypothetical protein